MDTAIDRFSWRRVWLIGHYMLPTLKKQLIVYPLAAVLMSVMSQLFCYFGLIQLTEVGIMNSFAGLIFYFAPVSLARRDNRFIIVQLPAKISEKFAFLLIYYWVVIGVLTFGLSMLTSKCLGLFFPSPVNPDFKVIMETLTGVLGYKLDFIIVGGYLSGLALQAFALFGVVRAKTNRMLTGIGYTIVSYIAMCVISGLSAAVLAFVQIWKFKSEYGDMVSVDVEEFTTAVVSDLLPSVMAFITIIFCFIGVLLLYRTYKIIKHRGF